jgi:hypothetical protein
VEARAFEKEKKNCLTKGKKGKKYISNTETVRVQRILFWETQKETIKASQKGICHV